MSDLIEFIYNLFSKWFKLKSNNESRWNGVWRGFIGVILITVSISLVILSIYFFSKLKNAA